MGSDAVIRVGGMKLPLETVPDMTLRADEIDDLRVLVHRVLYRNGRIGQVLRDGEPQLLSERRRTVTALTGSNRADLYRLEELLETIRA